MEIQMMIFSMLLILSVYSAKLSKKFNIPLLVVFMFVGMATGSDGLGWVYYDDPDSAYLIATVSLCVILFAGGLKTDIGTVKPVIREGLFLSVFGVLFSVLFFAIPIYYFTGLSWSLAFLASATVASTDAAAVFSLLEFSGLNIKSKIKSLLEFESGSNDPLAYVMVILFISLVKGNGETGLYYFWFFVKQLSIGFLMGLVLGYLSEKFIERLNLKIEALYSILLLGILGFTYSATALAQGNGYLAIYILGLSISSKKFLYKNSCVKFFSVLSWTMQIILFLCLGLFLFPRQLGAFTLVGVILAVIMVLVIRPLSVFASLYFFKEKYDAKSKLFLSIGGFKGAVAIVFAIFTMVEKVPHSETIFNLIFFIVLLSVVLQGSTLRFFAKKLGVTADNPSSVKQNTDTEDLEFMENNMFELTIIDASPFINKSISEIFIPYDILITLIKRNDIYIHPKGTTKLKCGDRVTIMCREKDGLIEYLAKKDPASIITA